MKKLTLIICIASLVQVPFASAQVGFGPRGGLNLASIDFDDPEATYDSRAGFHVGLFMRARFDKVALQPEVLLFTQNGESQTAFNPVDVRESFTYLSVPVLFKFYPFMGLNVHVGPQFGFLIDGEQEYEVAQVIVKRDITEVYEKSDVAISAGVGYDFDFGLGLDLRYNIGVKDINNLENGEPAKSKVFLASVSWNFLK